MIEIILSIVAIVISLSTFVYTIWTKKKRLKIEFYDTYFYKEDDNAYTLVIECCISNRSSNPINISSMYVIFDDKNLKAISVPLGIRGNSFPTLNQTVTFEDKSITLPLKLEPYDSRETFLLFPYCPDKVTPISKTKVKLVLNTSRGIVKKKFNIEFNV